MKVYVVMYYCYENTDIIGVYSSKQKAIEVIPTSPVTKDRSLSRYNPENYDIIEYEVQ